MLSNWWYPPEGNRSSTDEGRYDTDDDTQVMEPDQGNGKLPSSASGSSIMSGFLCSQLLQQCSSVAHHSATAPWSRPQSRRFTDLYLGATEYVGKNYQVGALYPVAAKTQLS